MGNVEPRVPSPSLILLSALRVNGQLQRMGKAGTFLCALRPPPGQTVAAVARLGSWSSSWLDKRGARGAGACLQTGECALQSFRVEKRRDPDAGAAGAGAFERQRLPGCCGGLRRSAPSKLLGAPPPGWAREPLSSPAARNVERSCGTPAGRNGHALESTPHPPKSPNLFSQAGA